MNEITQIHLGRQPFTISVDAHKELRQYLDAIAKEVGPKNKEVVEEIELRMAELLVERGITGDKVILAKDVAYLKEQLGDPTDFKEDGDGQAESTEPKATAKRLFRDTQTGMLAGVSSGIAEYLGISPIITRLLFVLAILSGGWGVLLYVVLWLVIPEAKTSSDRLQMRGKAVTVDNLKEVVAQADIEGAARRAGSWIQPIFEKILNLLRVLSGVALVVAGLGALVAEGAFGTYIAAHHQRLIGNVAAFPVGPLETSAVVAGFVFAGLILVLMLCAGLSLLRRKWVLPVWVTAVIGAVILVAASVGGALAPDTIHRSHVRYESTRTHVTRTLQPYTDIRLTAGVVGYRHVVSDTYKVDVSYLGNVDPSNVRITQDGQTVSVDITDLPQHEDCDFICLGGDPVVDVTVYAPEIKSVDKKDAVLYDLPADENFRTQ